MQTMSLTTTRSKLTLSLCINAFLSTPLSEHWKSFRNHTKLIVKWEIVSLAYCRLTFIPFSQAQSDLILASPVNPSTLSSLTQEIIGFFIVENHVLRTTEFFRSEQLIEELWDAVVDKLSSSVEDVLESETETEEFLRVKESLVAFMTTLEVLMML